MALGIDRDFASTEATLRTLATSPYLTSNDLSAFYTQTKEMLQGQMNTNIVLSNVGGKQYVNTLRPFGTALPLQGKHPHLKVVAETGQTVISTLFTGPVTNRPVVVMGVPVRRGDKFLYNLSAGMFPERFGKLLDQ